MNAQFEKVAAAGLYVCGGYLMLAATLLLKRRTTGAAWTLGVMAAAAWAAGWALLH